MGNADEWGMGQRSDDRPCEFPIQHSPFPIERRSGGAWTAPHGLTLAGGEVDYRIWLRLAGIASGGRKLQGLVAELADAQG